MKKHILLAALAISLIPATIRAEGLEVTFALFSRSWPPFEIVHAEEPGGLAVDLLKATLPEGVTMQVVLDPAPRKRLYSTEFGITARLEEKAWMRKDVDLLWSDPVIELSSVLISSSDNPVDFRTLADLEGKTIGCIKQYVYPGLEPLFKAGKATRYDVNSDQVLLRMLKAGRLDAIVMDDISARWQISQSLDFTPKDFHFTDKALYTAHLRFAFSNSPEWRQYMPKLNANIKALRCSRKMKELLSKYE